MVLIAIEQLQCPFENPAIDHAHQVVSFRYRDKLIGRHKTARFINHSDKHFIVRLTTCQGLDSLAVKLKSVLPKCVFYILHLRQLLFTPHQRGIAGLVNNNPGFRFIFCSGQRYFCRINMI